MQLLKKLTISTLGFSKGQINAALRPLVEAHEKAMVAAKEKNDQEKIIALEAERIRVPLANIVGSSSAAQPGQTANGDFIKFAGDFAATKVDTGEIVATSGICILPQFIAVQLAEALKTSESIEFALRVFAEYNAKSVTGYVFVVETLQEPKVTDRMSKLLALASNAQPAALEAPKAQETSTPAPAPEAAPAKGKGSK